MKGRRKEKQSQVFFGSLILGGSLASLLLRRAKRIEVVGTNVVVLPLNFMSYCNPILKTFILFWP